MQTYRYFPMTLIAVAIVSGCSSMPQNSSLTEAHNRYNSARTHPEVTNLAALELKAADESLSKADYALSEGESDDTVDHLTYLAKQQVANCWIRGHQRYCKTRIILSDAKVTSLHARQDLDRAMFLCSIPYRLSSILPIDFNLT
jgi:hypothetical protein